MSFLFLNPEFLGMPAMWQPQYTKNFEIDLANMKSQDRYILNELLKENPSKTRFKKGKTYKCSLIHPETNSKKSIRIKVSHTLIKRACHPGGKHTGDYRYEVLSNDKPIGKLGAEAYIHRTVGTITPARKSSELLFKPKIRIVKVFGIEEPIETALREYNKTPRYLRMKPVVTAGGESYIFMRLVTGDTLATVLERDAITPLSIEQRINLCVAVARALQTQVFDNNLIHCDFTPDNIMVRYSKTKRKWKVVILDFGQARWSNKNVHPPSGGKKGFIPPEASQSDPITQQFDIFSLARIFSHIFGCKEELSKTVILKEYKRGTISIKRFLENIHDADKISKKDLQTLLEQMSASKPADRPTTKDIITTLTEVQLTRGLAKLSL